MRSLRILALTLLVAGCSLLPEPKWSASRPEVFLHLGNASQVCAGASGHAPITIFANLYNLGEREVLFVIDDTFKIPLFGDTLQLDLAKVEVGQHWVTLHTKGFRDTRLSFSVWSCT